MRPDLRRPAPMSSRACTAKATTSNSPSMTSADGGQRSMSQGWSTLRPARRPRPGGRCRGVPSNVRFPLNQDAIAALAGLQASAAARVGLVFKRRNGAKWGQVRTAFATALKRAGIEKLQISRSPPHVRVPLHDAGRQRLRIERDPWALRHEDDSAVRPSLAAPPPRRRRAAEGPRDGAQWTHRWA
jgi:hypothetical protein